MTATAGVVMSSRDNGGVVPSGPLGEMLWRRMRERGYNQTTLAESAKSDGLVLRQNYISQLIRGEIAMPRDDKIATFERYLGLSKTDFYRAAGMLDGLDRNPSPPRQLALLSLTGEEEYDADALVAYVESRPGRIFQQQLAEARAERSYDEYVEFCLSIFRAWESNSNLGIKALALGRSTGTGGL